MAVPISFALGCRQPYKNPVNKRTNIIKVPQSAINVQSILDDAVRQLSRQDNEPSGIDDMCLLGNKFNRLLDNIPKVECACT